MHSVGNSTGGSSIETHRDAAAGIPINVGLSSSGCAAPYVGPHPPLA